MNISCLRKLLHCINDGTYSEHSYYNDLYVWMLPVSSSTDKIISTKCLEESDSLTSTCKRLMKAADDKVVKPESVLKETGKLPASSTETGG